VFNMPESLFTLPGILLNALIFNHLVISSLLPGRVHVRQEDCNA